MDMQAGKMLVTGATGFVGRRLCRAAVESGFSVRPALRRPGNMNGVVTGDISRHTDWSAALEGVAAVVHLAARQHIIEETAQDPLDEYRRVNTDATVNLAKQAAMAGVRRFVFISSVKVNGEATLPGRPFSTKDLPNPKNPYALSKQEAETELHSLAEETGLEVVIIRPPLVYGPGVKANFLRILKAIHTGMPLPLGLVHNRRSLVAMDNLVDLIITCARHPDAAGQTFFVSDGEDLSTPELVRKLAGSLGRPARLLPLPPRLLKIGGRITGLAPEVERLCGSLQVDISKTTAVLGWHPPVSVDIALQKTAAHFKQKQQIVN